MKQIIIIANSITDSNSMSGGDKNFIELAKVWKNEGHQVFVVTTKTGKEMCQKAGLDTGFLLLPDLNPRKFGVLLCYLFRSLTSFFVLKSTFQPLTSNFLILSSSHYLPDLLPAFWFKRKFTEATWGTFLHLIFPSPLKGYHFAYRPGWQIPNLNETINWLFQFPSLLLIKHFCQRVFCVNEEIINRLTQKGFSKNQLCLYRNGVDHEFIDRIKPSSKIIFDGLFIGRFHPQKGLFDLVPIWNEVVKSFPEAKLGIIGSGPKLVTKQLAKTITSYKLDNHVVLLGFKEGKEKFEILKSSRVLLFPSYYESFGIVPLEAQASGIPVVAYNLPPLKSIFKKGIVLVPLGKIKDFANAIVSLLINKSNYTKLAHEALDHSKNFNWKKSAELVLKNIS